MTITTPRLCKHQELRIHVFIQWLAHKDVLDTWLEEVLFMSDEVLGNWEEHPLETRVNHIRSGFQCINLSFTWDDTRQGHEFWKGLSVEWDSLCRNELNGYLITGESMKELAEIVKDLPTIGIMK